MNAQIYLLECFSGILTDSLLPSFAQKKEMPPAMPSIDQILEKMEWGEKYHLFNIWTALNGPVGDKGAAERMKLLQLMLKHELVENYAIGHPDAEHSIRLTLLGEKIKKYKGGWEAYQRHQILIGYARSFIFYGTFIFAILAVFVPIYCSDQERKSDELMNQILLMRIEEAKQGKAVDSVLWGQKITKEMLEKIQKADSEQSEILRKLKKKEQPSSTKK